MDKKHPDTHLVCHARIWPAKDDRKESVTIYAAALNDNRFDTSNEFEAPRKISTTDPDLVKLFKDRMFPAYARISTRTRTLPARDGMPERVYENIRAVSDVEDLA